MVKNDYRKCQLWLSLDDYNLLDPLNQSLSFILDAGIAVDSAAVS